MKNNLSIYLIKDEFKEFSQIIKDDTIVLHDYDIDTKAYYLSSNSRIPKWLTYFFELDNDKLFVSNAKVLLLKRVEISNSEKRIFAIAFGYGKNLMKDNVCEEQFGLKIVLNTVNSDKIRKIIKTEIGKNYKSSQEQLPKESNIEEFGFDISSDLIKNVTARCSDDGFGNVIITGGDIFNVTVDKKISNIDSFLKYCYNKYILDNYKEQFKWVDNIRLVKEKTIINKLNNKVVELLNDRNFYSVWLAVPEVLDWEKVRTFYISGQKDKNAFYMDIDNNVFIDSFENSKINDFQQIRKKTISVKSNEDENEFIAKWTADKCLVGSVTLDNQEYTINNGKWYKIKNEFVKEINDYYNNIPISSIEFINCSNGMKEDGYNDLFYEKNKDSIKTHKINIPIDTGSNRMEPFDFVLNNNYIFIKRGGNSSTLSHLFFQACNSCNALKDKEFRKKLNKKFREKNINYEINEPFDASEHTIVLGIISEQNVGERPHVPFFSKISAKLVCQQILNLGYKFELKSIHYEKN